jgi:hypothetical protein
MPAFLKIIKILNWLAVVITISILATYIGASLYNANEFNENFIYISLLTAPFILVLLLTIWTLKTVFNRITLLVTLLANLILLLLNLATSYLTYVDGKFHASNPQIYGNSDSWMVGAFVVSVPLILLSANIVTLFFIDWHTRPSR